jgi:hypothetical protein
MVVSLFTRSIGTLDSEEDIVIDFGKDVDQD